MTQPEIAVPPPGPQLPVSSAVVHCSEGRFARQFEELLARIGSPDAEHISLPGGPWWFAEGSRLTRNRLARMAAQRALPARTTFRGLVAASGIRRLILLGHQDCAWYARLHPNMAPADHIRRQGEDILRARDGAAELFGPGVVISGHVLTFDDSGARFRTLF